MEAQRLAHRITLISESRITRLVDHLLSRNYLHGDRKRAWLRDSIECMDLATREDTDALGKRLDVLARKVEALSEKLESLRQEPPGHSAGKEAGS